MKEKKSKSIEIFLQFIKFSSVGVINTTIFLVTYYLLINLNVNYILANLSGFLISVINAYILNKKFVFKAQEKKSFVKVFMSYGMTTILSTILMYVMVDLLNISKNIAPLINLLITTPINFILNKMWAFK